MLRVIQRLQEESDSEASAILDEFLRTRKLEAKVCELISDIRHTHCLILACRDSISEHCQDTVQHNELDGGRPRV